MSPRFLGVQKPGGYADHVLVPHPRYLLDLGTLTPAQAAPFACSGITAFGALKRVGEAIFKEQPILVIGAGGVGTAAVQLGRAAGARVTATVRNPELRDRVAELGATVVEPDGFGEALAQSQAGTEIKARAAALSKVQHIVADNALMVPLVFDAQFNAFAKQVKGFEPNLFGRMRLDSVYLEG